ncbi:MAG: restriction endonuclease subunit S [Paludibacteraceae bacterium]|nr:restriction endonuclease subunit S [Paludibacteraceae bacterium]
MTHIEQMIQDMCPNGIEFKYLTDVANVLYGYPFEAEKFSEDERNIPLIRIRDVVPAKASTYYTGTYPKEFIIKAGDILVGMDGNFNLEKWKDRNGLLNQRVCKIYSKNSDAVLDNFLYHLLKPLFKKIEDEIKGGTVKHLSAARIKQIEIPLPPIEIQKKIVECLDKFSALAAELQAELQMRRKQYEYYRTRLLTPHSESDSTDNTDDATSSSWQWKTLGEICELVKERVSAAELNENNYVGVENLLSNKQGKIPSVSVPATGNVIKFSKDNILIGNIRPYLRKIWFADCDGGTNGDVITLEIKDKYQNMILPKFLYHALADERFFIYDTQYSSGAKMPRGDKDKVMEYKIPLPSLAEQERIVSILDKFEALTTSLSEGIPAEQAAQQKRYEYYRDLLLTFDRKAE